MSSLLSSIVVLASIIGATVIPPRAGPPFKQRDGGGRLLGSSFGVPGDNVTYDYLIVGGGNAGLTLATRLAEQQHGTVGVIEAGSFYEITNGNLSQVPATDGAFTGRSLTDWQPLIDWGYATTPQEVSTQPHPRKWGSGSTLEANTRYY